MAGVEWIKLKVDMFEHSKLEYISTLPDADSLVIIWIKLLCFAGKLNQNGDICITENVPCSIDFLAKKFDKKPSVVAAAIKLFESLGMIVIDSETNLISIKNWGKYQSADKLEKLKERDRERQRKCRERKKSEQVITPVSELPLPENKKSSSDVALPSRDNSVTDNVTLDTKECDMSRDCHATKDVTSHADVALPSRDLSFENKNKSKNIVSSTILPNSKVITKPKGINNIYNIQTTVKEQDTEVVENVKNINSPLDMEHINACIDYYQSTLRPFYNMYEAEMIRTLAAENSFELFKSAVDIAVSKNVKGPAVWKYVQTCIDNIKNNKIPGKPPSTNDPEKTIAEAQRLMESGEIYEL